MYCVLQKSGKERIPSGENDHSGKSSHGNTDHALNFAALTPLKS
jgi:hypothetical protein